MSHPKHWNALLLSMLLLASLLLTNCAPMPATPQASTTGQAEPAGAAEPAKTEAPAPEAQAEKILVHARAADSATMDPGEMTAAPDWKPVGQIFDTLVRYDQTMQIIPHLATSWETSDDGLEWTFNLRQDVKFHDGTPLNAEAVVFTFERAYNEDHPAHAIGTWDNWSWYLYMVQKVEAVGDYAVKFTLEYPYAPFLDTLANNATSIVSPAAYMEKKDKFRVEPVGSGPFKFVEWMKDDRIVLEKNPDYFLGEPKLDKLIYRVMPESTTRLSALKTGEAHVLSDVPPEIAQLIEKEPALHLVSHPGLDISFIRFNMRPDLEGYQEPLGDRRVREALAHSIDRQAILDRFFLGYGEVAENPIPSVIWGRDESLKLPEYDPQKARELLAEAGYPDGFETTLRFWPVPFASLPQPAKIAEAIQSYLKEVGIDAEIVVEEEGTHWEAFTTGKTNLVITGWVGDFADPHNFLAPMWEDEVAGFDAGWKNAEFKDLINSAQQETDQAKRTELYYQAQKIFFDELPGLPLFTGMKIGAYSDKVVDLVMRPDGEMSYFNVDLKVE
jgi:peptide/nickel transport system substrate-binding protein